MALTATQKVKIRYYLGYADLSAGFYSLLENAMNNLTAEAEAQVIIVLDKLDAIETSAGNAAARGGIKRVEEIEFFPTGGGLFEIYTEGNRLVRLLAALLGITDFAYPFGGVTVGNAGRG